MTCAKLFRSTRNYPTLFALFRVTKCALYCSRNSDWQSQSSEGRSTDPPCTQSRFPVSRFVGFQLHNPTMRTWKSVFLIGLSQFFVQITNFKIRLNIGLYKYINTVWRNTKCYSKIGVIRFWNTVCHLPSYPPSQTTSPSALHSSDRVPSSDTWRPFRE